jgi:hypothetical protein
MAFSKFGLILPLVASYAAGSYAAGEIQVNMWYNGDCTNFAGSFNPFIDGSCYNYSWGGTNSEAMVNCPYYACECIFYTLPDCGGSYQIMKDNTCASNGGGFQSVKCSHSYS